MSKKIKNKFKNLNRDDLKKEIASTMDRGTIIVIVVSVLVLGWVLSQAIFFDKSFFDDSNVDKKVKEKQEPEEEIEYECDYMRNLDGICVDSEEETNPDLIAVMVENHWEAQPLSGISKASVVYEAPVEGRIPRFMLLFNANDSVSKVGPVRSARPYYLDWLSEYPGAMYMHVGGSPEALEKIDRIGVFDMNEFSRGWYFWRSSDRYAPHNAYTRSDHWQSALETYGDRKSVVVEPWKYSLMDGCEEEEESETKELESNVDNDVELYEEGAEEHDIDSEDESGELKCVNKIYMTYVPGVYQPYWVYDSEKGQYLRYQHGKRHLEQDGSEVWADTVVVQWADIEVIDNYGRLRMDTLNGGRTMVFRDGHAIEGEWEKNSTDSRTKFIGKSGKEIPLKPGKIWVQVLPSDAKFWTE